MCANKRLPAVIDPLVFKPEYLPDRPVAREKDIARILKLLSPLLQGEAPVHIWLYGPSGTGKTMVARLILQELKEKHGCNGQLVNCWENDTLFEILDFLITEMRILRADEHSTRMKLDKLRRHLDGRPFVLALDEIDRIKPADRSETLYNMVSIGNVGVICISTTLDALLELDVRVRSRLTPFTVRLPPYSASDLSRILLDRASRGLAAGSWSEQHLRTISSISSGDARLAIRGLHTAAQLSSAGVDMSMSTRQLEQEHSNIKHARHEQVLAQLTEDHRILYAIVSQRSEIQSGKLRREYVKACGDKQRIPVAERTFTKYISRLVQSKLILAEQARTKGKSRVFRRV